VKDLGAEDDKEFFFYLADTACNRNIPHLLCGAGCFADPLRRRIGIVRTAFPATGTAGVMQFLLRDNLPVRQYRTGRLCQ
jgi:hypothetical protein